MPFALASDNRESAMISNWFKRFLPRSLFVRALLILLLPVILLQLVVGFVFIQRHFEAVTEQMTRSVARNLNYAIAVVDTAPSVPEANAVLDFVSGPLGLPLTLDTKSMSVTPDNRSFFDLSGRAVIRTLQEMIQADVGVDLVSDARIVKVQIKTNKGVVLADLPRSRVAVSNPHQLLVLMVFASILLTAISILFLRNQIKPILNLTYAAEEFGKGRSIAYRPRGAEEVRRAGTAFLAMRSRLERQIEQRTQMLSGVSHDLRTPLTRLKLSLAMLEGEAEKTDMLTDIRDMERMLDEFLAFAKGGITEETIEFSPVDMAHEIGEDWVRLGRTLDLYIDNATPKNPLVSLRYFAVKRAVQNLVNNAERFGARVTLTLRLSERSIEFVVEDDGPGIPADQREAALRPFVQLDESRNQNDGGGVGLGLAIAMDIARSHGGTLALDQSESLGGLKATLRLPR